MRLILIATLWLLLSVAPIPPAIRVSAPAGALQPGSVLLLTIDSDDPLPALRARAFGSEFVPFSVGTRSALALVGFYLSLEHGRTDLLRPSGLPIKAPNAGRVVLAGPLYFTGGTVVIDHGLGVLSLFAHMSTIDVREGDVVKTDDVIGAVGATGRVTGPHLHWAVRLAGARVDPISLLAVRLQ